jgi:hypothetical protein
MVLSGEPEDGPLRYVGMRTDEAVQAAEADKVRQVRIIEMAAELPFKADGHGD